MLVFSRREGECLLWPIAAAPLAELQQPILKSAHCTLSLSRISVKISKISVDFVFHLMREFRQRVAHQKSYTVFTVILGVKFPIKTKRMAVNTECNSSQFSPTQ